MTILLTGFEAFGKVEVNPSQEIITAIAQLDYPDVVTAILPVVYEDAEKQLVHLMTTYQPDAVLMLGVAQNRDAMNLERIALNIDDAHLSDNAGVLKLGEKIADDSLVGYWSTLPLEALYQAMKIADVPVKYSNHAGAYLCNHAFFVARHWLETQGKGHIPCGFIHVPSAGDVAPALPLKDMVRAIEVSIAVLQKTIAREALS